jgi:eukaryotic-like serine/threonine-protein kinase
VSLTATVIEGRYQLIARIASGGMGEVFRAHDSVLARDVAVKVLHPQLAGDRGFVERFRREARAAAILNHPNIVSVYDWGTSDGTYFMVMEFVQGMNLRTLLTEFNRLEAVQVVEVTLRVLAALDHAHRHGIVHRDVKPENILIARDGAVKVADFGLARAYAESSVSQAEGTVTGTVQYLAPEQIQGEPADPRTDLYALGVVMFELLTGQPPFTGETSLAIAYQHLSNRVPAPSTVSPFAPPVLDGPVLKATEKDRDHRPVSARAFGEDLMRVASSLPSGPTVRELAGRVEPAEATPVEQAPTVTIPRSLSPKARRARRFRRIAVALLLIVGLVGGGWAGWVYAIPHYTHVPHVVGVAQDDAVAALRQAGLSIRLGPAEHSDVVPVGAVIRTVPAEGAKIRKGAEVLVVSSLGPEQFAVPPVTGMTQDEATAALTDLGLAVEVKQDYDDTVPEGSVISQNPDSGVKLEHGDTVTITVSEGPPPVAIPNVVGQPEDQAKQTLKDLGFTVKVERDYSTEVPEGDVISVEPPAKTKITKFSTVTITVSKGPKTFAMPNVVGMSRAGAVALLEGRGLHVFVVTLPNSNPPDTVVYQDPVPGDTVQQGQLATLYVTQP